MNNTDLEEEFSKYVEQMNLKELLELQKRISDMVYYELLGRNLIKED